MARVFAFLIRKQYVAGELNESVKKNDGHPSFLAMTEALSKAYNEISTLALRNARTTPRIS